MNRLLKTLVVRLVLLLGAGLAYSQTAVLFQDSFSRPDGLIASQVSPSSADWDVLSGSLWASGSAAWTGVPDNVALGGASKATNSSVFRLLTRRSDFGDVAFSLSLVNRALSATSTTPPVAWDGVHLLLRYQDDGRFYHVAVNRRDDTVIIKKRVLGGPSESDAYYNLTPLMRYPVPYNKPQAMRALARNEADGSVLIELYSGEILLARARDTGAAGGPALTASGRLGVGGDNCDFLFDDVSVVAAGVADSQGPVIGTVEVSNLTESLATIFWTTDKPSDSQVEYGFSSAYGSRTPRAGAMVVSHSAALSGLKTATSYHFRVRSRDAAGNLALSAEQIFTTGAGMDTQQPEVFIVSPAHGAAVTGIVEVSASAADNVAVAGVQLRLDGVNLGAEDLQPPYSETWDSARSANGNHVLTAVARDAAGNLSVSAPATITVVNQAGKKPSI